MRAAAADLEVARSDDSLTAAQFRCATDELAAAELRVSLAEDALMSAEQVHAFLRSNIEIARAEQAASAARSIAAAVRLWLFCKQAVCVPFEEGYSCILWFAPHERAGSF
jgi:hypothetical protein